MQAITGPDAGKMALQNKIKDYIVSVILVLPSMVFEANSFNTWTSPVSDYLPNGYNALTVVPRNSGNPNLTFTVCQIDKGTITVRLRNLSNSSINISANATLLCVRDI